jgi:tetratricopeptide (TPR) repeat protein
LDEDCLALARDGQPRPAERCFVRRSQGAGLSAEMALYELARLRRDVLGDTQGALGALGDYRQRFPAGSLRNEVDVSRIELLARLERRQEALSASEQLLATPAGRERAAELRLLRGKVLRASGSLREAVAEYASAERLGGALADEATFLRAQCLEALGDVAAARQAYGRAAQSAGPRRSEARERLAALPRSTP